MEIESSLRIPAPRTTECNLERRRHFLKLAARLGIVGLGLPGVGGLALAWQGAGGGGTGGGGTGTRTCTTTTTYTSSSTSSTTQPSSPSGTETQTLTCTGAGGGTTTAPASFTSSGSFTYEDQGKSTYSASYSVTMGYPGTGTYSFSPCVGGTLTLTYSFPSIPSWSFSGSTTMSGTRTVTCESQGFTPPGAGQAPFEATLPVTLQDGASVLHSSGRSGGARARHLALLACHSQKD